MICKSLALLHPSRLPCAISGGHSRDHYIREQEKAAREYALYQKLLIEDAIFAERKKQEEEHAHLREIASNNLTLQTPEIPALIDRARFGTQMATNHLINLGVNKCILVKDINTMQKALPPLDKFLNLIVQWKSITLDKSKAIRLYIDNNYNFRLVQL